MRRAERLDWNAIKGRIDLAAVATELLGSPAKRQRGKLLWRCPFHDDRDPSLVVDPVRGRWVCWPCNISGDAASLAEEVKGLGFPAAVRLVAEMCGLAASSGIVRPTIAQKPIKALARPSRRPSGLPAADALDLVAKAAERLWTPEGMRTLSYLHARGLTDETIRAARLGYVDSASIPMRDGSRCYRVSGVSIPWFDRDRLAMAKIRQPEGRKPKYVEAYRYRPMLFPGPDAIRPGRPLIIVEGEFDCLLLAQEHADLASVVTLGSASAQLESATRGMMLFAHPWYVATDADDAGDKAATTWQEHGALWVRPPEGCKDWTDVYASGRNRVRYIWGRHLAMSASWDTLASARWGPALHEHQAVENPNVRARIQRFDALIGRGERTESLT